MLALALGIIVSFRGSLSAAEPQHVKGPNGHEMILVPAGDYAIGGKDYPRNPQRSIHLAAYLVADAETTNEQFAKFVEATHYVTNAEHRGFGKVFIEGMPDWAWKEMPGAHWRKPRGEQGPSWEDIKNHPVTQISGADARAYCEWAGLRLPTLEEWEVAARAGAITRYPWGDNYDPKMANTWDGASHLKNTKEDGYVYTAPVKSYPPNAWGLYDVIGNVFEYCSGHLPGTPRTDEKRFICGRGGSWWCSANTCHFFNLVDIGAMDIHGSLANQGFRVVKTATP